MLFNSYQFIFIFLPFTLIGYFILSKKSNIISKLFLIFVSLFFYSWWNFIYLPIIIFSILFNYNISKILYRYNQKTILFISIILNLSLLGYFKYRDFFVENINYIFDSNFTLLHLALPLAISFFTFQQISYLVDCYKKDIKEYNFLDYTLFVTFFPQLIAGPIVHYREMIPQFNKNSNLTKNYHNIALGIFIFSIGLFKKVAIADTFGGWVDSGFDTSTRLNIFEAWSTSLSYTFQLYFDFSGYTDMAIGSALLFNITLPTNFNSPYKSYNIQEFWRRWHITLSNFLRDYIYIPLGGSRVGLFQTNINILITFLLAGLWHGASWLFVFWGFLHGLALVIYNLWDKFSFRLNRYISWFITFNFINISWVFFRAKEWEDAIKILKSMIDINSIKDINFSINIYKIIAILLAFFIILILQNSNYYIKHFKYSIYNLLFIIISIVSFHFISITYSKSIFLYFNF